MRREGEDGKAPEEIAEERIAKAQRERDTMLHLVGLELTKLPAGIGKLTRLEDLNAQDDRLTCLPEAIGNLTQLKRLYLWDNQLTSLPEAIGNLTQLTHLYLSRNPLTSLPEAMRQMNGLEQLHLDGNDALGVPAEVMQGLDPAAILDYYFRTREGARPLNEAKLILVGRGEVGKTCIVNRLVEDRFDPDTGKTAGIQISDWELPCAPDPVQLHIWDFGGQEIMHATHQFFLTERSLYLLVLNGREGGEDLDVEYWLKLIQSFGGASPVIVVLNKIHAHPFDLNYRAVQRKYPQVRGFVKTDCKQPVGIKELQAAITEAVADMPDVRANFPKAWFTIKDRLARMKQETGRNYISYPEYKALCKEEGEREGRAQDDLAGYLHCLGVALNYRDDPRLRETSLLNPHWVTNGIYRLLNSQELAANKGVLHLSDLGKLLPAGDYPTDKHLFLLALMAKFRLCFGFFDHSDPHYPRYLVPELLDKQEPDLGDEFNPRKCLNFEYRYGVLPEGMLPSFIVRSHALSEGQARWRNGVILEWQGCKALVKADVEERRITISVHRSKGAGPRQLLAVIRSDFEQMHRQIKALEVEELVPVPEAPEVKLRYADLLGFERDGVETLPVLINGKTKLLSVKALLGEVDLTPPPPPEKPGTPREQPLRLFISYSHKDHRFRDRLDTSLKLLHREGKIAAWHDRQLLPSDDWAGQIDKNLQAADIVVLLVSDDFIASDYCYNVEMEAALAREAAGEARVVPVIVRTCQWQSCFAGHHALPENGRAVTQWRDRDAAWKSVADGLRRLVDELTKERKP